MIDKPIDSLIMSKRIRNFQAVFYRDTDGSVPVEDFISVLKPSRKRAVLRNQIGLLNKLNNAMPHLAFPHSSQIEGEFRELRCHYGRDLYRIIYRRSEQLIVLLHVIEKRTRQIPTQDKQLARKRWADFKRRMDEHPRRPPRAAGPDAP